MKNTCKRCGHKWASRIEKKPRACPNCKSYKWDLERGMHRPKEEGQDRESYTDTQDRESYS